MVLETSPQGRAEKVIQSAGLPGFAFVGLLAHCLLGLEAVGERVLERIA